MILRWAFAIALLLGVPGNASAQSISPSMPTFRGSGALFTIQVQVVGVGRRSLPTLSSRDFTVQIDGQPRAVRFAELVRVEDGRTPVLPTRGLAGRWDHDGFFQPVPKSASALYVLGISAINTFLYFDQLDLLAKTYPDPKDRTAVLAQIDTTVQALTVLLQVFATGRIASRWGLGVLLTVVPITMIFGMGTLAAMHTFAALVTVIIIRRVGEYAFVRPGREMLYGSLPAETKYKAKNFIDTVVYRGGDALTASVHDALVRAMAPGLAGIAALGIAISLLWAALGAWLGRPGSADVNDPTT